MHAELKYFFTKLHNFFCIFLLLSKIYFYLRRNAKNIGFFHNFSCT